MKKRYHIGTASPKGSSDKSKTTLDFDPKEISTSNSWSKQKKLAQQAKTTQGVFGTGVAMHYRRRYNLDDSFFKKYFYYQARIF